MSRKFGVEELNKLCEDNSLSKQNIENIYPLTPLQEGILYHYLLDKESQAYIINVSLKLKGKLDVDICIKAWEKVVEKHEILRTIFIHDFVIPIQVVLKKQKLTIDFNDLRGGTPEATEKQNNNTLFELDKEPGFKVTINQLKDELFSFNISTHHILIDGWCISLLHADFNYFYGQLSNNQDVSIEKGAKYSSYIKWLAQQDKDKSELFWREYLSNYETLVSVPKDQMLIEKESKRHLRHHFTLTEDLSTELEGVAKGNQLTLYSLFQTIWGILLAYYNNTDDVVFGSVVSGRPSEIEDVDSIVGLFINTIPTRINIKSEKTITEILKEVYQESIESKNHHYFPLAEIQNQSNLKNNLFDHIMVFENFPSYDDNESAEEQKHGVTVESFVGEDSLHYNFGISIMPDSKLGIVFYYNENCYSLETLQRIEKHLKGLIKEVVTNPDKKVIDLEIISPIEKEQIFNEFNRTHKSFPDNKTVLNVLQEKIKLTPNKVALSYKHEQISYKVLGNRVNSLSGFLQAQGLHRGEIVGIRTERSFEMLYGIYGILMAGAVYVPIDPSYPIERVKYIMKDCGARFLLTNNKFQTTANDEFKVIDLQNPELYNEESSLVINEIKPEDLAYVIYTSGSTGEPKGIPVEHGSLANIMYSLQDLYPLSTDDVYLLKTNYTFDVSLTEIFGWFFGNGSLSILENGFEKEPEMITSQIERHAVTHINFTPSMLLPYLDWLNENSPKSAHSLKYIFSAGEALSPKIYALMEDFFPHVKIENIYGPTEATIYSTNYSLNSAENKTLVPIGKPMYNSFSLVLSKDEKLLPIGVPGELCIAGRLLARGYLNNVELSAKQFISASYPNINRLYRTGDLVRWMPDGNIEYLGRIDNQVKIRGYRIELGEIEVELSKHENIKEVAVIVSEQSSDTILCAYYISTVQLDSSKLKKFLLKKLPSYMVPAFFIQVESIPYTTSGKVDKKNLTKSFRISDNKYIPPKNEVENKLAECWAAILNIEKKSIGANIPFAELGGHSLKSIQLIASIKKSFGVTLSVKDIFHSQTINEQAEKIESSVSINNFQIVQAEKKEYYPLAQAQKRLYFLQVLDANSTAYNMPQFIQIKGNLDINKLKQTFYALIESQESFRTSILLIKNKPVQKVHDQIEFDIEVVETDKNRLDELCREFIQPFDLHNAPFLHVQIAKLSEEEYILMIDMHHIISDGISDEIIINSFKSVYQGNQISSPAVQYKDYSEFLNKDYRTNSLQKQFEYWKSVFNDELPVLELPYDYPRPKHQSFAGSSINFEIDTFLHESLNKIARDNGATMFSVLLSMYNILLQKITNQTDFIVGSPVAGRNHSDLWDIVGVFINTLAYRNKPEGDKSFIEFLNEVKVNCLNALDNQELQLEELIDSLGVSRDLSRNPLFDSMFVLQSSESATDDDSSDFLGLQISPKESKSNIAKFDLTLTAQEKGNKLAFNLEYCTSLFKEETILRFIEYFKNIVSSLVEDPNRKISQIDVLTEKEKDILVNTFSGTKTDFSRNKSIVIVFKEQVELFPNKTALRFNDDFISYKELDAYSDIIAHALREQGAIFDEAIGVIFERSIDFVASILAVLKVGAVYLPLNTKEKSSRIKYQVDDSQVGIILSNTSVNVDLPSNILRIDVDTLDRQKEVSVKMPCRKCCKLAYIMYTSGTTGVPKGTLIEQRGVLRLVKATNYLDFSESDVILQTGALTFDATTFEVWGTLLNGGTLAFTEDQNIVDARKLAPVLLKNEVNILWLTSSLFNLLAEQDYTLFSSLKYLLVGGDILSPYHINKVRDANPELIIINGYGPTEHTTFSSTFRIDKNYETSIPIGKPLSNSNALILTADMQLAPVGVIGELHVGGYGTARGYLNQPILTQDKFIRNPFVYRDILYKTGDLARWLPDGNIEFFGRIDRQVKIRGYRIELKEIETVLTQFPGINETVIVVKKNKGNEKYLCAYYVAEKEIDETNLQEYLKNNLEDYKVPSNYMQLEYIPYTNNGKINTQALPDFDYKRKTEIVAPTNKVEEKLLAIWAELLEIPKDSISIDVNFFDIGGNSLNALQLTSLVQQSFSIDLPLKDIFSSSTIAMLAVLIKNYSKTKHVPIRSAEKREYYKLSSAQNRQYILQKLSLASTAYNMPQFLEIVGEVNIPKFEKAFKQVIAYHECFRTSIRELNGEPYQFISHDVDFSLTVYEVDEEHIEKSIQEFVRPFNLSKAPFLRAELLKVSNVKYVLMMDMHHIISDGISDRLIIRDFVHSYLNIETKPLKIQYKDYSVWQHSKSQQEKLAQQSEYWLNRFNKEIPVLDLPTDYPRPSIQSSEGGVYSFSIQGEQYNALQELANKSESTLYMLVLGAINIWLSRLSGLEDIIVGSPVGGRRHADLFNVIGMFVNTITLNNFPKGEKRISEFLTEVKENVIEAIDNQDYPFEELVNNLNLERNLSRNPLFDVMFSFHDNQERSLDGPDSLIDGLNIAPKTQRNISSKFDLEIETTATNSALEFSLIYCSKLFKKETVARFAMYLQTVIKSITADTNRRIMDIDILSSFEKESMLKNLCEPTKTKYSLEGIVEDFEANVRKFPHKIAVIHNGYQISYSELNKQVNRLARTMVNSVNDTGNIVGIYLDRDINFLISILAVYKSGNAFIPIDTEFPHERVKNIIQQTELVSIISDSDFKDLIDSIKSEKLLRNKIYLDEIDLNDTDCDNLNIKINKSDLAYVLFTSGSTGVPKGVMIRHDGMLNHIEAKVKDLQITSSDVMAQTASVCFDISVWQFLQMPVIGGTVIIIDKAITLSPQKSLLKLQNEKITIWELVPSLLSVFLEVVINIPNKELPYLRWVVPTGESLSLKLLKKWFEVYPTVKLMNAYGPAEASDDICCHIYDSFSDDYQEIIIGKALHNFCVLILDEYNNICPVGVKGEICVSGIGIGNGYINNPEKTDEVFIENPYTSSIESHKIMYKTGDVGFMKEDGNIVCKGRKDYQVKIHGQRVELGEIENQILRIENITEASVIITNDKNNNNCLAAYYIGNETQEEVFNELLSEFLPSYMIPDYYINMTKFPLTINGKIDKKLLPIPQREEREIREEQISETEKKIIDIWSKILTVKPETIRVSDDFFGIGGHSIVLAKAIYHMQIELKVEIEMLDFYDKNIRQLAKQCDQAILVSVGGNEII